MEIYAAAPPPLMPSLSRGLYILSAVYCRFTQYYSQPLGLFVTFCMRVFFLRVSLCLLVMLRYPVHRAGEHVRRRSLRMHFVCVSVCLCVRTCKTNFNFVLDVSQCLRFSSSFFVCVFCALARSLVLRNYETMDGWIVGARIECACRTFYEKLYRTQQR